MEYKIISASENLVGQIAGLEKICFSMPWTEEQIRSQLPDGNHDFIAAVNPDGELMGYVGLMYVLDEGYISNVAVAPQYRRQHIGSALISELIKRSYALKLSFLTLEVRESNLPAQKLYGSFDFKPAGIRKNYYDFPKENAIIMTKFMK